MGKILTVPNIILTPPGARNVSARMAGLPWGPDYIEKIQRMFGSDLLGLWSHGEAPGSISAIDYSVLRSPGVYTNVALGQQGIGGSTCARYDGSTSYNDVYSAARNSAFQPGQEGTVFALAGVLNDGVWADGVARNICFFDTGAGTNTIAMRRTATNGEFRFSYTAGGILKQVLDTSQNGRVGLVHWGMTYSLSVDQMKAYINGFQVGATQTGLGTWSGALYATQTNIGATTQTPASVWNGWIGYFGWLKRAATPAEMAQVAEG